MQHSPGGNSRIPTYFEHIATRVLVCQNYFLTDCCFQIENMFFTRISFSARIKKSSRWSEVWWNECFLEGADCFWRRKWRFDWFLLFLTIRWGFRGNNPVSIRGAVWYNRSGSWSGQRRVEDNQVVVGKNSQLACSCFSLSRSWSFGMCVHHAWTHTLWIMRKWVNLLHMNIPSPGVPAIQTAVSIITGRSRFQT